MSDLATDLKFIAASKGTHALPIFAQHQRPAIEIKGEHAVLTLDEVMQRRDHNARESTLDASDRKELENFLQLVTSPPLSLGEAWLTLGEAKGHKSPDGREIFTKHSAQMLIPLTRLDPKKLAEIRTGIESEQTAGVRNALAEAAKLVCPDPDSVKPASFNPIEVWEGKNGFTSGPTIALPVGTQANANEMLPLVERMMANAKFSGANPHLQVIKTNAPEEKGYSLRIIGFGDANSETLEKITHILTSPQTGIQALAASEPAKGTEAFASLLRKYGYQAELEVELQKGRACIKGLDGAAVSMLQQFGMPLRPFKGGHIIDVPLHSPKPFNLQTHITSLGRALDGAERETNATLVGRLARQFYPERFHEGVTATSETNPFHDVLTVTLSSGMAAQNQKLLTHLQTHLADSGFSARLQPGSPGAPPKLQVTAAVFQMGDVFIGQRPSQTQLHARLAQALVAAPLAQVSAQNSR